MEDIATYHSTLDPILDALNVLAKALLENRMGVAESLARYAIKRL